jgi:sec-independent protein translocase protein TatB
MNIFSNVGITELVLILLLALIVVGPERLPELAQQLGKVLRDVRKMYENLASDLGPELMSLQESTKDLRDSVESVRSIPKDVVQQVVQAAELDETIGELQDVKDSVDQMGRTLSDAKKVVQDPVTAAVDSARSTLAPDESAPTEQAAETQEKADSAEAPQSSAQKSGPVPQPKAGDGAEESESKVPETEVILDTAADLAADAPEPKVQVIVGAAPEAQEMSNEESLPEQQATRELEEVERDHE